jgi:hypothetical protein
MRGVAASMKHGFCDACFSGDYVIPVDEIKAVEKQIPLFEDEAPDSPSD